MCAKFVEVEFSFDALEKLSKAMGQPLEKLRAAGRIAPLTRRKKEKKPSPGESDRLVSVSRLLAQTFELFVENLTGRLEHRIFT